MVAINDVAKRAKVAVGTVSRVLNGHANVAPTLRVRVEKAIEELGYRPNAFAQSLRRQKSLTFGLIIPDVTDPFFAHLVKDIDEIAAQMGYSIILGNSNNAAAIQRRYVEELTSKRVDALILVPSVDTQAEDIHIDTPLIILDRPLRGHSVVATDHKGGAVMAVNYLLRLGHKRIACIAGPERLSIAQERLAGFREAMKEVPAKQRLGRSDEVRFAEFDFDSGYKAALDILGRNNRPTAIFASSDQQAIGAMRAAADLSISVPGELSIVGYDDIPLARHVSPRLTTISQDARRIAAVALERVLSMVGGESEGQTILVEPALRIRDSAAAPR